MGAPLALVELEDRRGVAVAEESSNGSTSNSTPVKASKRCEFRSRAQRTSSSHRAPSQAARLVGLGSFERRNESRLQALAVAMKQSSGVLNPGVLDDLSDRAPSTAQVPRSKVTGCRPRSAVPWSILRPTPWSG